MAKPLLIVSMMLISCSSVKGRFQVYYVETRLTLLPLSFDDNKVLKSQLDMLIFV